MVRNKRLLRWIVLLELSDLLLDVFTGFVPLYFTDVVGATPAQAGLLLTLLMLTGLASDLALIPLLERIPGRTLVRASAALSVFVYAAWLVVPWPAAKIALLILVSLTTLGWYPVLQGEAYASAPGQSGAVSAFSSIAGALKGGLIWLIGFAASQAGLPAAMWLLLLGPVSLALFVPREEVIGDR
jgi:FSR family fosmidomycin resistance protein-like MFS transporter